MTMKGKVKKINVARRSGYIRTLCYIWIKEKRPEVLEAIIAEAHFRYPSSAKKPHPHTTILPAELRKLV